MTVINIPGLVPSLDDLHESIPIGISVLGTPVYDDITFPSGSFIDKDGNTVDYDELQLQSAVVSVNLEKNIVETQVSGRNGTIKEYISDGDYSISIDAKITELFNVIPFDQMERWRRIAGAPESISIISKFLNNIFDIFNVIITRFTINNIPGSLNEIDLRIELKSDIDFDPDEFVINETTV